MASSQNYVDSGIPAAKAAETACNLSTGSWERGTAAIALLELYNPELSVFSKDPFPNGKLPHVEVKDVRCLQYAKGFIKADGDALQPDTVCVSDPCSIGVAAELLAVTDKNYAQATARQVDTVLKKAPRYANGAISHRHDVTELWADNIYMAPPFLAYHAVATDNPEILRTAIEQCKLYRDILMDKSEDRMAGLWRHIVGPEHEDLGFWSTSCGWAAAGMARVLATLLKWPKSQDWEEEAEMLKEWIQQIIAGAAENDDEEESGLLRNYLGDESWWGEVAGTALIASVVYRMAVIDPDVFDEHSIEWAEAKRHAVVKFVDQQTGIAAPTVNPRKHLQREKMTTGSPEAQSFLVLLHAAYRDWMYTQSDQVFSFEK